MKIHHNSALVPGCGFGLDFAHHLAPILKVGFTNFVIFSTCSFGRRRGR
jgi:hypothetical protein